MGPTLGVVNTPSFYSRLGLVNGLEPVDVQALIPERAIEGLDEAVVGRLARSVEVDGDSPVISPEIEHPAGELTAVINEDTSRRAAPCRQAVAGWRDVLGAQPLTDHDVGRVRARTKNSVSGMVVSRVYFDPNFPPSQAVGLDLDGDGGTDALAVLGEDAGGLVRAQVKDLETRTRVAAVRFQSGYRAEPMVVLPDADDSGTPELAVLQTQGDTVRVQIKDAVSGQPIKTFGWAAGYRPRDPAVLEDLNGNGKAELAYLGEDQSGGLALEVRDAYTGERISRSTLP